MNHANGRMDVRRPANCLVGDLCALAAGLRIVDHRDDPNADQCAQPVRDALERQPKLVSFLIVAQGWNTPGLPLGGPAAGPDGLPAWPGTPAALLPPAAAGVPGPAGAGAGVAPTLPAPAGGA